MRPFRYVHCLDYGGGRVLTPVARASGIGDSPVASVLRGGACVALALGLALAPTAPRAQARSLAVSPSLNVTQEFTDNRDLRSVDPQADSVTTISPGLRISSSAARFQASLDYVLSGTAYARLSQANSISHALSAGLAAELVEDHAFLDARASISQQAISALDLQGNRPNRINANSTELRTLTVSPSLRARPMGWMRFDATLVSTVSQSADNQASDLNSHSAVVRLGSSGPGLGWTLESSRAISDYKAGRRTTQDRVTASLNYAFAVGLNAYARAGRERDNVQSDNFRPRDTWGLGGAWQPTPRTQISAQMDRRYFGDSHGLTLSHRMKRSVWTYGDSRSVTENTAGSSVSLSTYELFFRQFESVEPDPVQRDLLVRSFLQAAGLDPNARLNGGFLSTALSVQRSRNLSLALQGVRSNLVLSASNSATRRLDRFSAAQDDLSRSGELRQTGISLTLSHRLSALSSIVFSLSGQKTEGEAGVEGNDLATANLSWATRVGRYGDFSASLRHVQARGLNPYDESALRGTYSLRF